MSASGSDPQASPPRQTVNYNQLFENFKDKPCHVEQIKVTEQPGPLRTKDHLYRADLERLHEAKSLNELLEYIGLADTRWKALGMFKNITFHIDESAKGDANAALVNVLLEEVRPMSGKVGTYMQGGESSVEAEVAVRNVTGHAEKLSGRIEYGSKHSNTYAAAYRHPFLLGLPGIAELKVQKTFRNQQEWSSYTQHLLSAGASLSSLDGKHQLGYEAGWRRLVDPTALASRAVQQHAGEYLLSTLQYTYLLDHRDSPVVNREGWAFRSQSAFTGGLPGARPQHLKQQLDWTWAAPITDSSFFTFSGSLGVLLPWGAQAGAHPTTICDRFFLGGPSTLRGFGLAGAGPTDLRRPPPVLMSPDTTSTTATPPPPVGRDALGGDLYTSLMASVMFELPVTALQALNVHGHAFINGGNVVALSGRRSDGFGALGASASVRDGLQEFSSTFRWSAGVGLVFPTWFGRLELNAVRVLAAQEHDRAKSGLQLGFSSSAFAA